ncbi:NucA/NucB deoxyribonuclease domain-containing protein [Streptomyces sp. enrichment culture]|uniref:NucA/NucB deoxyribonuclease domain-containing protein n=1 Tax=Streptomyces sp. enrichment culture TaxID=1795815 RepID=UPI003F56C00D
MRIRRSATAGLLAAVCMTGLLQGTSHASGKPPAQAVELDPNADTSGTIVWARFGSPDEIPNVEIGQKVAPQALISGHDSAATAATKTKPNTLTAQPATSPPTPRSQQEMARKLGQTYRADGTEPRDKQIDKLRSSLQKGVANGPSPAPGTGIIDFAKCESDAAGKAATKNSPGHIIDHFNFCRWGYNQAVKLDGRGKIEGLIRFKEIEIGVGAKGTRTGTIYVNTKNLVGEGIYSEFSGATMTIQPTAVGNIQHLGECGKNNLTDMRGASFYNAPVAAWEDIFLAYDIKSDENLASSSRMDKVSYCKFETHYKVDSPKGSTPWSDVSPTGSMRFDSATYIPDAQYGSKGAVFDWVTPSFNYDRKDTAVKEVAEHIYEALYAPQLTYPQKSDKDIPGNIWNGEWQPLHRNVKTGAYGTFSPDSDAIAEDNEKAKDAACAGLNRPTDYDCDEFPFASTKEGAGVGDGNFSVRMVPSGVNRSAGSKLGAWYSRDRILDGDAYGIWVD